VQLHLTRPDDFHLHLRDGEALGTTVPATARTFSRAVVMPNLVPPITTADQAKAYKERILAQRPPGSSFQPLMTLYLTDATCPDTIRAAQAAGDVYAVKLYPAGATTHSAAGVTAMEKVFPALEAMIDVGLPLLVHGEVTDATVDIFDREQLFIEHELWPLIKRYPELRVVMEHITTRQAVEFVREAGDAVAATVTPQHLLYNRNHLLAGGLRPHLYCLPVLKCERHRQALVEAATSGEPCFFLGTDSAPHGRQFKEAACGCAGCYSAFGALELYAEVFEQAGALERLEAFASHFGADFYQLPRNTETIRLEKKPQPVPAAFPFGKEQVVPLRGGEFLQWTLL